MSGVRTYNLKITNLFRRRQRIPLGYWVLTAIGDKTLDIFVVNLFIAQPNAFCRARGSVHSFHISTI